MIEYINKEDAQDIIDRELFNHLSNYERLMIEYVINAKMDEISSADVVEVVRCKDCMYMHANKNNRQLTCNRRMLGAVRPNDYCSLGAKMDEEEQENE